MPIPLSPATGLLRGTLRYCQTLTASIHDTPKDDKRKQAAIRPHTPDGEDHRHGKVGEAHRAHTLEQKIDEVDKIETMESCVELLKDHIWAVKEVLTTAEASAYLGLSESYLYKLTSSKRIPHYKPNGKLVYFNRRELCEWAMKNQVQTAEPTACTNDETI